MLAKARPPSTVAPAQGTPLNCKQARQVTAGKRLSAATYLRASVAATLTCALSVQARTVAFSPLPGLSSFSGSASHGLPPITMDEVRDALGVERGERITLSAAPAMPLHLGRAVCGRVNVTARGMPPRYIFVRYANASPTNRVFREPRGDVERKSLFYVIWKQLGCIQS